MAVKDDLLLEGPAWTRLRHETNRRDFEYACEVVKRELLRGGGGKGDKKEDW